MAIHIDSDGNFYFGASGTTEFDSLSYTPVFSVTKDGLLTATSGTIGGWTIGSTELSSGNISIDSTGEISANYSSSTGWKLEADGDAFFNSVDVRIDSAASATPSTGKTTLDVGNTQIYTFNNDLYLNTTGTNNAVYVKDQLILTASSSSASNMQLMFDGLSSGDAMGFWHDSDFPNSSDAELYWTNQSGSGDYNKIAYVTTQDDYFHLGSDAPGIKTDFTGSPTMYFDGPGSPGTDSALFNMAVTPYAIKDKDGQVGSSGQVLSSTGSRIDWIDLPASGGAHADSDHTSFLTSIPAEYLTQTEGDTRYVQSSGHSHNNFVDHVDTSSGGSGGTDALTISNNGIRVNFGTTGTRVAVGDHTHPSGSGVTSVSGSTSAAADGTFFRTLAVAGTTLYFYESTRGDNLTIEGQRPTSNNASSVGLSATQYNEVHARYGYFDFITGGNVSSQEVKTDITDLDLGIDFINSLKPKKYKYKPELKEDDGKYGFGFIAEEIETLLENEGQSNSKLHQDGHTDYPNYGRCAHELVCTCEDEECCPDPVRAFDAITQEWEYTPGCVKDAKCTMPCCTDVAGATINGINYVHATEEECEESYIDGRKFSSVIKEELIAPLVKSVQELSTQISDLTARVEALEG